MSFFDDEKSIHDGRRRHLYHFVLLGGDQPEYNYTSHPSALGYDGGTYIPATIRHGPVGAVGSGRPSEMIVTCAYNLGVVNELMLKLPPRSTHLTIYRYHSSVVNISKIWEGEVRNCRVAGLFAELRVPSSMMETLDGAIPTVNAQSMCNHMLYDPRCGLARASFKVATSVASIDSSDARIVTMNDSLGSDQIMRAGEVVRVSDGERRLIVDQVGLVCTLDRAFRNLAASDSVDVYQGCDHTMPTCDSKFANKANFGGIPYIPAERLFRIGVRRS